MTQTQKDLHPLLDPKVQAVLAREHGLAEADDDKLAEVRPAIEEAKREQPGFGTYAHLYPSDVYLSIDPEMGQFLTLAAESIGAGRIVEFGTSFGISTIYLAAAVKARGGQVIGSELEVNKVARARENLAEAELSEQCDVREGDALQTLQSVESPIDMVFLDGWKELYLPVLKLLEPKLRPGALVLADNIHTFPDDLAPFLDYVSRPDGPYRTTVIPFDSGLAYSLFAP